jgi:3-hydroxy-9,10-secoandrosta-1,3,5(10)-triene-9,17-dione monooxygenase reductase component
MAASMALEGNSDTHRFRHVMSLFPTGVAVVTAMGVAGPAGMTANAISSLSLEPMLLMVGFDLRARTLQAVRESGRFAVNFLSREQEPVSRRFASKLPEADKFAETPYRVGLGVPILADATGWVVCAARSFHEGGDHVIGVGEVIGMDADPAEPEPLVFYRSGYCGVRAGTPYRRAG